MSRTGEGVARATGLAESVPMVSTSISLLERLRGGGDPDAWERFVTLYAPVLSLWGRRAGLQAADVADFVQEVLLHLCHKIGAFDTGREGRFRDWLRVVALNRWRERARKRRETPRDVSRDEIPEPAPAREFWEREFADVLTARVLDLARGEFEESTWRAFWGTAVQGRGADEVAAELGLSRGAVYTAKSRVLAKLRRELAGMCD